MPNDTISREDFLHSWDMVKLADFIFGLTEDKDMMSKPLVAGPSEVSITKNVSIEHGDGWGYDISLDDEHNVVLQYFERGEHNKKQKVRQPTTICTLVALQVAEQIIDLVKNGGKV